MPIDLKEITFPTTRYQGSKRKILDWISESVQDLPFDTVLDAFGGTGSVSYLFKVMGKSVTYNDILTFNHYIGKALIENQDVIISEEDINFILDFDSIPNSNNFISRTFNDFYFTDEENVWLDNIVQRIEMLNANDENETSIKKSMCFYAVFQACLRKRPFNLFHRKNLYLRTNDVKRNFGNKTTWEKPFELEFRNFIKELNESIFDNQSPCYSINISAFDIDNNFDLVYFDIPYIKYEGSNETSDYERIYHFLEGMTDYKNWENRIDYQTNNLRFFQNNENPFSYSNIKDSIRRLFDNYQNSILVFSYKIGGLPTVEEIEDLMREFKPNVITKSKHYKYALNKQNGNAKFNREVLIIGTHG